MAHFLANIRITILMYLQNAYQKGFLEFEPQNKPDRDATSPSNDPLHEIGGPMTRSKTKRMT